MSKRKCIYNQDFIVLFWKFFDTIGFYFVVVIVCSFDIFEVNRGVNSKWVIFELCHYCFQLAVSTAKFETYETYRTLIVQVIINVAPAVASQALSWRHPLTVPHPRPYLPASYGKQFSNPTYDRHILPQNTCVPQGPSRFASAHSLSAPRAVHSASNWPLGSPLRRH